MPVGQHKVKRRTTNKHGVKRGSDPFAWLGPKPSRTTMAAFGFRLNRGGAHQSKTMMLAELQALLVTPSRAPKAMRDAVVVDNVLGKRTANTRKLTYRHLASLYGLKDRPPLTRLLLALWQQHPASRPLIALLVALARDPLLRDTARVVVEASIGMSVQRPVFETPDRPMTVERLGYRQHAPATGIL